MIAWYRCPIMISWKPVMILARATWPTARLGAESFNLIYR